MSNQTPRKRRTRQQWQQLIEQWQASGVSAPQFCSEHHIAYSSFCKWRQHFSTPTDSENDMPGFIGLSHISTEQTQGWRIILKLGQGVELELSQG